MLNLSSLNFEYNKCGLCFNFYKGFYMFILFIEFYLCFIVYIDKIIF